MPVSSPRRPRNAQPLCIVASCILATVLTGCASSGPLVATAPRGVDLSGEWRLNENLSDDAQRIGDEQKEAPPKLNAPSRNPGGFGRPGTGVPGLPSGPGGIDPGGSNDNLTSNGSAPDFMPVRFGQSTGLPPSASDSPPQPAGGKPNSREGSVAHMLDAPPLLTISQSGSKLIVRSSTDATTDEYTAGEQRTIPFGQTEADRISGWRDAAFVVITKAKKGPSKEDDFALDGEGHLIFATLVTHVKKGPIDFKRVYDRVRAPN